MDIRFDFEIHGVPDKIEAESIAASIMRVLRKDHQTDMWITYEDVTE